MARAHNAPRTPANASNMNAIKKARTEHGARRRRLHVDDIAGAKKCEQKPRDACLRQLEFYFSYDVAVRSTTTSTSRRRQSSRALHC